jgi:4-hydroxy-tetrahydrodipicolinate reductase
MERLNRHLVSKFVANVPVTIRPMTEALKIAVLGAAGRMGLSVVRAVSAARDLELVAAIERKDSAHLGRDIGELAGIGKIGLSTGTRLELADVLIDFSSPEVMQELLEHCSRKGIALVSGTTGIDEAARLALQQAAASIPVLWAPNLSIGVQLTYQLAAQCARAIGQQADIEITEAHHRFKQDAPSGTALQLVQVMADAMGTDANAVMIAGRHGADCRRENGEIGVSSVRAGDIVGEHTVLFALAGERIELTHRAASREAFVNGALMAARWLASRAPGLYSFANVLGLEAGNPS